LESSGKGLGATGDLLERPGWIKARAL